MIGWRFLLLLVLVSSASACHRYTNDAVLHVGSDPSAPPLPLELLFCASGKSVEVGETGYIILVAGEDVRYGQVSMEQLRSLQALLASEEYLTDLRKAEQKPGPVSCMGEPSVFIMHKARRQRFRFVLGAETPATITTLLQFVYSLAIQGYGPGYDPFASSGHSVKPNPHIKLSACGTRSPGQHRRLTHAAAYLHRSTAVRRLES
jgi:hypothetical protein